MTAADSLSLCLYVLAWMKRLPMTAATEEMAALASACDEKVTRADLFRCKQTCHTSVAWRARTGNRRWLTKGRRGEE